MLPNHNISPEGEFQGFLFQCSEEDMASKLPVSTQCLAATCVYECQSVGSVNPYLQLVMDMHSTTTKFQALIDEIKCDPKLQQ